MYRKNKFKVSLQIILFIIVTTLFSCTTNKNLIYLQDKKNVESVTITKSIEKDFLLKSGDALYINVVGLGENNFVGASEERSMNELSVYLQSYIIDDSGSIDLPLIGKVIVGNKSIKDAKTILEKEVSKYMKSFTVSLKLVNYRITVLGEVRKPGVILINSDRVNILEALGFAGDLLDTGNRKKIKIIRETTEGHKIYFIDLTDKNILYSDYFNLLPNDLVYIEPLQSKRYGLTNMTQTLQIVLSIISSTLSIYFLTDRVK